MRDLIQEEIEAYLKENKEISNELLILWDGHCRLCSQKQQECTYDIGLECRYPDDIRYSMEAVGINVTKTVRNLNLDIEWPPKNYAYRFGLICNK